ncbi:MAG TPA: hypothetical protein VEG08_09185 [Terriglobales bacterium]|nr:hypothetical protein [Terriglobales bacterium]
MIFGFNTDVRYGDILYHVMTEPRPDDLLFQSVVFVRGRCLGKRAWSYAGHTRRPGFSELQMHELLKDQHRRVLEDIRMGKLALLLGDEAEVTDVGGELGLKCLNPETLYSSSGLAVEVQVTAGGQGVAGAHVTGRVGNAPISAETRTDAQGVARIHLPLERLAPGDLALWVEAGLGGKSVTRKLRLRKNV